MQQDKRDLLLNALNNYKTEYADEVGFVPEIIKFVEENENCFERGNLAGHITGSAWVLSPDGTKALLTHHKKLNRWLQLGGHSDGEHETWNVALREAEEESGIVGIDFITREIFDIDIHSIPENPKKSEPEHKHYDVRFLLQAPTEQFAISDESNDLKWVSIDELNEMGKQISDAMGRMIDKWKKVKS